MASNDEIMDFFAKIIFKELGIVYSPTNYYQLEVRLRDVAKHLAISNISELYTQAKKGISQEMKLAIFDLATNNETLFFRDKAAFSAIENIVLSLDSARKAKQIPFRVWSAACSTGQEVYSLAMLFDRMKKHLPDGYDIVATDINDRVLKQAQAGKYSQLEIQRGLSAADLAQHFTEDSSLGEKRWTANSSLKRNISFKKLNLLDDYIGLGPFDLILCRNVLIYQTTEQRTDIVSRLNACLTENGYLMLGAAESLFGISNDYEMVQIDHATLYQKKSKIEKAG